MGIKEAVERHSSVIFISGILIGSLTDSFSSFEFLIPYILMFIMFLSFLKTDFQRIAHYMKRPGFILLISFVQMIFFPAIFYLFFALINDELAIAVLLLVSLPSAVLSPVLTHMFKGETNLSVILVLLNHIISVFSIPFLFYFLIGEKLSLDLTLLTFSLFQLIIIPLILAVIVLLKFNDRVKKIDPYFNSIAILSIFLITLFALSPQHDYIFANLFTCLNMVVFQSLIFASLFVMYYMPMKLSREERKTVTISKSFMNNMLGLVIAIEFLSPYYTIFMVLTGIPWILMLIASKRIYAPDSLRPRIS